MKLNEVKFAPARVFCSFTVCRFPRLFSIVSLFLILFSAQTSSGQLAPVTSFGNLFAVGNPINHVNLGAGAEPAAFHGSENALSSNFNFSETLYTLPGRSSVSLTLSYFSQHFNSTGSWQGSASHVDGALPFYASYDAPQATPPPGAAYSFAIGRGFDLGLGSLEFEGACESDPDGPNPPWSWVLISPDGTRTMIYGENSVIGTTGNGGFQGKLTYDDVYPWPANPIITHSDGTRVVYGATRSFLGADSCRHVTFFPTKVVDRNGNYIVVQYSGNVGPRIQTITDTLGRVIEYHYSSDGKRLSHITVPGFEPNTRRELIRFFYQTIARTMDFSYYGPAFNYTAYEPAPQYVYIPATKTGWRFSYSTYGMVYKIEKLAGMRVDANGGLVDDGQVLASTEYNYPQTPSQLYDAPKFTMRTDDWVGNPNGPIVHNFNVSYENNSEVAVATVTSPDGTVREAKSYNAPYEACRSYSYSLCHRRGVVFEQSIKKAGRTYQKVTNVWDFARERNVNGSQGIEDQLKEVIVENEAGQRSKTVFVYDEIRNVPNPYPAPRWNWIEGYTNIRSVAQYGFNNELLKKIDYEYEGGQSWKDRWLIKLIKSAKVYDGANALVARTDYAYDAGEPLASYPTIGMHEIVSNFRGNLTSTTQYTNASTPTQGDVLISKKDYDVVGNVLKTTDPKGNISTFEYSPEFGYAYCTKIASPAPDQFGGLNGSSEPLDTSIGFNFNTGLVTWTRDPNGQMTVNDYSDAAYRLKRTTFSNGGQVSFDYGDEDDIYIKKTIKLDSNNSIDSIDHFNGRGWKTYNERFDNGVSIRTESKYDVMGRLSQTSNPYRYDVQGQQGETPFWTETKYDALGRITEIKTPDGAIARTAYNGNATTVTDPAGNQRRSITNALGQLKRIDEPTTDGLGDLEAPKQPTFYEYDVLNNLTSVRQDGTNPQQCGGVVSCSQSRTFVYDSISRLKRSTNSESGMTEFTYDVNGNLQTKRDARNIKTIYEYDALNRIVKRCYRQIGAGGLGMLKCTDNSETAEPNTADVTYFYDNLPNSKGRLTRVVTGTGSIPLAVTEYQSFDDAGRVTQHQQWVDGIAYGGPMTYAYNLAGGLVEQKYPSGRIVKNSIDSNGDLMQVQSRRANDTLRNYANGFTYTAAGSIASFRLGNGKWESRQYNSRLQPTEIALGDSAGNGETLKLGYQYGVLDLETLQPIAGTNNGNIAKHTITVSSVPGYSGFVANQYYTYDSLNRLRIAMETPEGQPFQLSWKQEFKYDRYGNRRFEEAPTTTLPKLCLDGTTPVVCASDIPRVNPIVNSSDNKLDGYTFDAVGNTELDAENHKFTYDASNKQVKVEKFDQNGNLNLVGEYAYNGEGQRIKKVVPNGETTVFAYDLYGKLITEYSTTVAPADAAEISYLTNDHLGSPRISTNAFGKVIARHDYYPFGQEVVGAGGRNSALGYKGESIRKRFAGYESDIETSLEFAQNRYYSSSIGRFTTADPLMASAKVWSPQSWNRYSYVNNNPINSTDPVGLDGDGDGKIPWWFLPCNDGTCSPEFGTGYTDASQLIDPSNFIYVNTAVDKDHVWALSIVGGQGVARAFPIGEAGLAAAGEWLAAAGTAVGPAAYMAVTAALLYYSVNAHPEIAPALSARVPSPEAAAASQLGKMLAEIDWSSLFNEVDEDEVPEVDEASTPPPLPTTANANGPDDPNKPSIPAAKDLTKLSRSEINRLQDGGEDVHELKGGRGAASKFDLYKDRDGRVYVVRKGGVGEPDPTNVNINDF